MFRKKEGVADVNVHAKYVDENTTHITLSFSGDGKPYTITMTEKQFAKLASQVQTCMSAIRPADTSMADHMAMWQGMRNN